MKDENTDLSLSMKVFEINYSELDVSDRQILKSTSSYMYGFYQKEISRYHHRTQIRLLEDERERTDNDIKALKDILVGTGKSLLRELEYAKREEGLRNKVGKAEKLILHLLGLNTFKEGGELYPHTPQTPDNSMKDIYEVIEKYFKGIDEALGGGRDGLLGYERSLSSLFREHQEYRYKDREYLHLTRMMLTLKAGGVVTDFYGDSSEKGADIIAPTETIYDIRARKEAVNNFFRHALRDPKIRHGVDSSSALKEKDAEQAIQRAERAIGESAIKAEETLREHIEKRMKELVKEGYSDHKAASIVHEEIKGAKGISSIKRYYKPEYNY